MGRSWAVVSLSLGLLSCSVAAPAASAADPARVRGVPIGSAVRVVQAPAATAVVPAAPPVSAGPVTSPVPYTTTPGALNYSPTPVGQMPPLVLENGPGTSGPVTGGPVASCPPVAIQPTYEGGVGTWRRELVDTCPCGFPAFWGSADYFHVWFKNQSIPALVTTNDDGLPPTLDRAGTRVLVGDSLKDQGRPGGYFTLGFGIPSGDPRESCAAFGVEGVFFFLAQEGEDFTFSSPGVPVLGRPVNVFTNGVPVPQVEAVANLAGVFRPLEGAVRVSADSSLYNFELNGLCNLCCQPCAGNWRVDFLGGLRFLSLSEDLSIFEGLLVQDGTGERIAVRDSFTTRNRFYGGQLGLRGERKIGNFFVQGTGKVAIGGVKQSVYIDGFTVDALPGLAPVRARGGLLALPTNIGRYTTNEFCVVPEAQVKVGYQPYPWLRLSVGYLFTYMSTVVRPGDQIDTTINRNFVPRFTGGVQEPVVPSLPIRPGVRFEQSDFWVQGLTAGIELRY